VKRLLGSFYVRIAMVYLALILVLGAGVVAIGFNAARMLFDEVEQRLNRGYAASIAAELAPLLADGYAPGRLDGAIHYMMVLNPRVEIYLLDATGRILAWFADPANPVERERVDLAPLWAFAADAGPVLGEDPRGTGRRKPFSAAPVAIGSGTGWVYVILGGERFDASLRMAGESYYVRAGLVTLAVAVATAIVAGLALFFLLTHRLASLADAARAFERGDLARRVPAKGRDEIGDVGRAFNAMAGTIESGMQRLRESDRLRRELAENVSHDLRTPLASLRGHLEILQLKDASLSGEQRQAMISIALRSADSLRRLVDELMELARLEARQVEPAREAFPLTELAQDIALKLAPAADALGVSLAVDGPRDLPSVSADIGMIERALTNLVENALRHTPAGGAVRIVLAREANAVGVTVSDTGAGIAPGDLPRVFDRFYRGGSEGGRPTGGAGLGLAIARGIVELHGGTLSVESAPGQGSRFRFSVTLS
jgi:signal transduction histidine kinase